MKNSSRKTLFICKGNWFRSQIAAAIYNKLTNSNLADSAGTYVGAPDEPEGQKLSDLITSNEFFEVMESHGITLRNNRTKKLSPSLLDEYDTVVCMAEEPYIPPYLKNNTKALCWEVNNPKEITKENTERTYELLYSLIQEKLLKQNYS